jgi:REP element-mobilizing transposase RayT
MPLLTNDAWPEKLARCVEAAGEETAMELVAFVFMPEHVHLLVYPTALNPSISHYLARIKQPFSKQIKEILAGQGSRLLSRLTVRERPRKTCFRFWQEGLGFDRNLFSPDAVSSSLECIHNNPVSRGFLSARLGLELVVGQILPRCSTTTAASKAASDSRFTRRSHRLRTGRTRTGKASGTLAKTPFETGLFGANRAIVMA